MNVNWGFIILNSIVGVLIALGVTFLLSWFIYWLRSL